MGKSEVYKRIASLLVAIENCKKTGNVEWQRRHRETIDELCRNELPSGSGFDCGTTLDDSSSPDRLVFNAPFHRMNDAGCYDGWVDIKVTIRASLAFGIDVKVMGIRERRDPGLRDYVTDCFMH